MVSMIEVIEGPVVGKAEDCATVVDVDTGVDEVLLEVDGGVVCPELALPVSVEELVEFVAV